MIFLIYINQSTMFKRIKSFFTRVDSKIQSTNDSDVIKVKIQKLKPIEYEYKETSFTSETMKYTLIDKNSKTSPKYNNIYSQSAFDNIIETRGSDAFFDCILKCYLNHGILVLKPDDILIHIGLNFSQYVNENSELLRSLFVTWKDKKQLIYKSNTFDFDDFINKIVEQISETINDKQLVQNLKCNFTTSTSLDLLISSTVIMDSFKSYYEIIAFLGCGITDVHFKGCIDDWKELIKKIESLKKYSIKEAPYWPKYIDCIIDNLTQWVNQMENKVSKSNTKTYWNKIMNIERSKFAYGGTDKISGWILNFYYSHVKNGANKIDYYGFRQFSKIVTNMSFKMVTCIQESECVIVSGFGGYKYDKQYNTYQLCPAIGVYEIQ